MSNYPNADYGPMPTYPSNIGESCATPKPYWFYDGATFCSDVTINTNLSVKQNLSVTGITRTNRLFVRGTEFVPVEFQGFLILAERGAHFRWYDGNQVPQSV